MSVGVSLLLGIPSLVASLGTDESEQEPWWAVPGMAVGVCFLVVGIGLLLGPPLVGRLRQRATKKKSQRRERPPKQSHDMETFNKLRAATKPAPLSRSVSPTRLWKRQALADRLYGELKVGKALRRTLDHGRTSIAIATTGLVPANQADVDAWERCVGGVLTDHPLLRADFDTAEPPSWEVSLGADPVAVRLDCKLKALAEVLNSLKD